MTRREIRRLLVEHYPQIEQASTALFKILTTEQKALLHLRYKERQTWIYIEHRLHISRATLSRYDAYIIDLLIKEISPLLDPL